LKIPKGQSEFVYRRRRCFIIQNYSTGRYSLDVLLFNYSTGRYLLDVLLFKTTVQADRYLLDALLFKTTVQADTCTVVK
jgi:hypothetical protein